METVTIDSTDKMDETRKLLIQQVVMEDKYNFLQNMTGYLEWKASEQLVFSMIDIRELRLR